MKRLTEMLFGRSRKQRKTAGKSRRRLLMERLDNRAMLAADFGAISGNVFFDTDDSGGFNAGDQVFANVDISITNQAGTFNDTTTSDVNGLYRFDDLVADTYTVTQDPPDPTGFQPAAGQTPKSITITVAEADTLQDPVTEGVVIDTFNASTLTLTADTAGTNPNQRSDVDAAVGFGTTRDLFMDITSAGAATITTNDTTNFPSGTLNFNPNGGVTADFNVTWDGDSDPLVLADTLSVDLTASGAATALQLQIGSDRPDATDTITVEVFSGNANSSSYTLPLVDFVAGGLSEVLIRFDDVPTATTGTGADFTDASAIRVTVSTNSGAIDTDVALVRSIGPTVTTANFENDALNPEINVEKSTNSQDADTPTGPGLTVGTTATFGYVVTNPGNTALGTVVLTDDNGTPGVPGDDFNPTFVGGDTNANNILETTETWTYSATRVVTAGQYTNISTVNANPVDAAGGDLGLADVNDTDPSNHFGVAAAINIEKATNGQDADTATGPLLEVGSNAAFTYVVTNTGNTSLDGVTVTDDQGVAVVFQGGDANANNILETTETWTYTGSRVVTAGQYTNIGTAVGNPVDAAGADFAGVADVTDTDPSNHFGVDPAINIEKATNGQDADTATGPQLGVGTQATFTYVVTNTGNTTLGTVVVTDDQGLVPALQSGDTNNNGLLETTETWTYTASAAVTAGQYTNIGTVDANPVDAAGDDIAGIANVNDTDPSNHLGVTPGVQIEKATNGVDADTTADQPELFSGTTATFTYVVTNTGNTSLGTVVVTDDQGVTPVLQSGDANSNNLLETTETWTYEATTLVTGGQYTNIGTVNANPVDSTGADIASIPDVTDSDPSNHLGVDLSKRRFLASFILNR